MQNCDSQNHCASLHMFPQRGQIESANKNLEMKAIAQFFHVPLPLNYTIKDTHQQRVGDARVCSHRLSVPRSALAVVLVLVLVVCLN